MRISDWSSDVCSSDLHRVVDELLVDHRHPALLHRQADDALAVDQDVAGGRAVEPRSEERRVGKEWGSTCRSRGAQFPKNKNKERKSAYEHTNTTEAVTNRR